jgi:hypothetical protein
VEEGHSNNIMTRLQKHLLLPTALLVIACLGVTAATKKDQRSFSILFVGDILLANEAEKHIHKKGVDYPFWKIKEELLRYDFIFANMESPITTRGVPVTKKPYVFRVRPADAVCLTDLKIDAVSISNNHLMDYGVDGMADTITTLDRLNIRHTGGGRNLAESRRPAILKYGSTNIIILAYCNRPPSDYYATDRGPGIAPLDISIIRDDIATYKLKDNIVVISVHWGIEQTHEPRSEQVKLARQIIDSGADAVVGHHPHWPQGIEIYRKKPIIYSLGNFINGYINPVERDNIAVGFYYHGSRLERIKVIPLAGRNRQIRFQPYVLAGKQADIFLGMIQGLSKKFGTTIEVSGGYGIIDPGARLILGARNGRQATPISARIKSIQPPSPGGSTVKIENK